MEHPVDQIKGIPKLVLEVLKKEQIILFRPSQSKALDKGLLEFKSLLICTPTASGKTLIAEIAALNAITKGVGKAVYIVPLKALANEKYKEFKKRYGDHIKVAISIGDLDKKEDFLQNFDFIICTAEKLDSLMRHECPWIKQVKVVIVDEIHMLNDVTRGPTLEVLITMLRQAQPSLQIVGLSATIGNPAELADWLKAEYVYDEWRPVKLRKGVLYDSQIHFDD